jgi:hypothetical protein
MKKLLVTLTAVLVASVSAMAQGNSAQISINNRNLTDAQGNTYQAPIGGDTTGGTAQLFLVGSGGTLTPLTPTTVFRTGAASPYLSAQVVDVPGIAPGGSATFVLQAWVGGASYGDAANTAKGQSAQFTVSGLGGTPVSGPPITPPSLNGLQSFDLAPVSFPEPSTIALATLGAAAFFIRRRK